MTDTNGYQPDPTRNNALGLSGVDFLHLREGLCKFPLGLINETPERFCGEVTQIGASYCSNVKAKPIHAPCVVVDHRIDDLCGFGLQ